MPLWARFLCAATSAAAAALTALALGAFWRLRYPAFWADLWNFIATARFWELAAQVWALSAGALVLGRILRAAAGWGRLPAGLLGGTVVALAFAAYTAGRHGLAPERAAADTALVAAGFALAGALATWVHERL